MMKPWEELKDAFLLSKQLTPTLVSNLIYICWIDDGPSIIHMFLVHKQPYMLEPSAIYPVKIWIQEMMLIPSAFFTYLDGLRGFFCCCCFFVLQLWVTWSAQDWSWWRRWARPAWMNVSPVRWGEPWSSPMLRTSRTGRSSMSERWSSFLGGEKTSFSCVKNDKKHAEVT